MRGSAESGSYAISANLKDGNAKNFIDADGKAVNVSFAACTVKIDNENNGSAESEIILTVDVPSQPEFVTDPVTGKITAVVTVGEGEIAKAVAEALKKLTTEKDKPENIGKVGLAEVKITAKTAAGLSAIKVNLIVADVRAIAAAKNIVLTIDGVIVKMTLDGAACKAVAEGKADREPVVIEGSLIAQSELTAAQSAAAGGEKVIELTITVTGAKVGDFKGGRVTVTLPYSPPAGYPANDYDLLTVYHLSGSGETTELAGSKYDTESKAVTFVTSHFSLFFASEWRNPFRDLKKSDWDYKNAHYVYS